ncbi:MAG TPA: C4-dicarboxylate transporter DctA [Steroidobacteraceae bacterium]
MIRLLRQLWFQVLLAMLAGTVLGYVSPALGAQMKPFGDAFIALVRMIIAPVIFCTVVHGVASMGDLRRAGRVALKALLYFLAMTLLALVLALLAVNLWKPGAGMNIDAAALDAQPVAAYASEVHHDGIVQFFLDIIPTTFTSAFVQSNILQVLLVSLLFAAGLSLIGERGRPVFALIEGLSQLFSRVVGLIMWAAPLGAFGALAFAVGRFGAASLVSLGKLLLEYYLVCLLFVFVLLGAVARAIGVSLIRLLGHIREELLIVAATTSSETVLPRLIHKMRALGCEESVVGLVIPTGYSFNLDGTCLYLATAAVFLAQATNTPLGFTAQLGLLAVLLVTSKGAAGVAGSAFIVLAATLSTLGTIPVASIALVLGIHRLMAEAMTFVNVVGNCVATLVVARWEGALDQHVLALQVGMRRSRSLPARGRSR